MKLPAANRFTVFGLVVLALVALAAMAWLSKPVTVAAAQQRQPQAPASAAVSAVARACPSPGTPGSRDQGVATVSAAAHPGSGQATISRLTTSATPATPGASLASLSQPGTLSLTTVPAAPGSPGSHASDKDSTPTSQPGGVMIQATGSMAQGLEAEQTSSGTVTAGCPAPGTNFWFAVPGQQTAGVITLYLMNTDSQASDIDIDIVTDTGPLQTGADTGITVPPHGLVVQSLASLVHGSRAIGVQVHASAGRIVAALNESTAASQPGQWLPPTQAPADRLVIPGLPASPGARQLYVTDPGGNDAAVKLSVVAAGGTYEPTGGGSISIPAGSASLISLPSLAGIAGAAMLTSNVPVTASFAVPGGLGGTPGAMTSAAPAVQEQGVIADIGQTGDTSTLVLSAPGRAARVRLVAGTSGLTSAGGGAGTGSVRVVPVPAGRSVTVTVARPPGVRQGFAVVLTPLPGSGPVYAGRVLARGDGTVLGILPVASALTTVPLPPVRGTVITAAP